MKTELRMKLQQSSIEILSLFLALAFSDLIFVCPITIPETFTMTRRTGDLQLIPYVTYSGDTSVNALTLTDDGLTSRAGVPPLTLLLTLTR